jgi:hypothetical protein
MSINNYLPNLQSSYTWFLYLGIIFFVTHLVIYGFGINLSYFGLILIYIGIKKPILSNWFRNVLWFFIILDIYANLSLLRERIDNRFFIPFDKKMKEGVKSKKKTSSRDDDDDEADDDDDE